MAKLCSKEVSSLKEQDSPFSEIIFLGYDDGPTSGVAQCKLSSATYRFEMVAKDATGKYDRQSWDRGEEIRIFTLATLPAESYQQFASVLSQPTSRNRVAEDEDYFKEVYSILETANPPYMAIATHGINKAILAAREISSGDIQDWFSFLGFAIGERDDGEDSI